MLGKRGLIFCAALLALFSGSAADAQYWRRPPPPGYWREGPPPRTYMTHDGEYRDYPAPPPPRRSYRPQYRCDRGSGGTILGAIAGGLLGNRAAGRGNRDIGTVFGAGAGALIGREVDRGC